jgi:hypothetical protein
MTLVDHLIEAPAEEIIGQWLVFQNSLKNSQFLNQKFSVPES